LTTGIYPWDVHDEGIETILDNLQNIGCNSAYMVALMHHEKRPCNHNYYPHNPVRKRYLAEDSCCYWIVNDAEYKNSRIKPRMSEREFLKGTDWLDIMLKGLRARGMKTGVEISHTPLDAERGAAEFSDCTQKDVYGDPPGYPRHTSSAHLCWNSPDAKEYVCSIARDLVRNHDVDFIQTCSWPFASGRSDLHPLLGVLLGGCFCKNCEAKARKAGLDWDAIVSKVKYYTDILTWRSLEGEEDYKLLMKGNSSETMLLLENPEIYQWLKFRCDSLTEYYKELSEAIHSVRPDVDFRINTCWSDAEKYGMDLSAIKPYVNSVRMMDYIEQRGKPELIYTKAQWLANVRRQVGQNMPIIGGIAPRGKATPQMIRDSIFLLADEGVDGLSFGFYDCAPMANLEAIKEGVENAGVIIRK
jgi:hypothetical protein